MYDSADISGLECRKTAIHITLTDAVTLNQSINQPINPFMLLFQADAAWL